MMTYEFKDCFAKIEVILFDFTSTCVNAGNVLWGLKASLELCFLPLVLMIL